MTEESTLKPALVMSGGGVRGAYEVGVMQGVLEVLRKTRTDSSPFSMFSGTSVGAINATFLAAHTHRGDLGITQLSQVWQSLRLDRDLRIDPLGVLGLKEGPLFPFFGRKNKRPTLDPDVPARRRSLLSASPIEGLIRDSIPWDALRTNVHLGRTQALFVTALRIATGRTTVFADLAEGVEFTPTTDVRRSARVEPITADHVLASAALPLIFPSRRIGRRYYADGGLRYNTPLAPVIRAGARKIMVISLLAPTTVVPEEQAVERYPNPIFLGGKLLNALLLDPIVQDLNVLQRFNKLIATLDEVLEPDERERVDTVMRELRGAPYQTIDTLIFRPSHDIGKLAADHIRTHLSRWRLTRPSSYMLSRVAREDAKWEADLASYLLFDGAFSRTLIDLGRTDALGRADEIRSFFGDA